MPSPFSMVMTTCSDRESAGLIAAQLVEGRLAACVQIFPIASVYRWEGAVQQAEEWMLLCKIRSSDYAAVELAIRAEHSYSNPEIIAVGIEMGASAYLDWIASATGRQ
jgi:periplasmic divalent cation tolerance protein